jgi:hypothetical protein
LRHARKLEKRAIKRRNRGLLQLAIATKNRARDLLIETPELPE